MELLGVDHVAINVDDVDAAIGFYTSMLGLSVRTDRPDFGFGGAWLDAGGQQVHLVQAPVAPALGQHFSLLVTDLDGLVGELRAEGVGVSDAMDNGQDRQCFTSDPAGNTIELHERGTAGR